MRRSLAAVLLAVLAACGGETQSQLKVASQNLYLGGPIFAVIAAPDAQAAAVATFQIWSMVQFTNFPARAQVIASDIAAQNPDVIGLQEVTTWRTGPAAVCAGADPSAPTASNVQYDFLTLLLTALLALLVAAWAGLLRIGWLLPTTGGLAAAHGPLMVSGFLGTLIGLERAVALAALGRRWVYIAPVLSALGVMTSLLGLPIGPWLLTAGSIALIAVFGEIIRRQSASFTYTMGFGAVLWAAGNVLWLAGWPVSR